MNRVPNLKELALLNMRVCDVANPNLLFEEYPRDCHIIPKLIFDIGKRIFMEHIFLRDESFIDRWHNANNHYCVLDNGYGQIECWCACDRSVQCKCGCMHIFHILIEKIIEENGTLNMQTKLKYALARYSMEF